MAVQLLGKVSYSPARDVYYILPDVVRDVAENLMERKPSPEINRLLTHFNITEVEVAQAVQAFVNFMTIAKGEPGVSLKQAIDKSGWRECHEMARVAVWANMGGMMTGIFFEGARCDISGSQSHEATMAALQAAGMELVEYARMPWWKRWWFRRNHVRSVSHFRG